MSREMCEKWKKIFFSRKLIDKKITLCIIYGSGIFIFAIYISY